MIVNTTTTMNQIDNNDALLQEHVNTIGKLTPERLQEMDTKINTIQEQSQYIMATANSLAQSIKTALGEMDRTQLKHEQVIQKNDSTVANLIQHSQVLWERNRVLEENQTRQQNELMQNVQQRQLTNQQIHALWNGQEMNRNQQNVADAQIQRMQSEMMRLREENRNRPMQNTTERGLQPSPQQAQKEKWYRRGTGHPKSPESNAGKGRGSGNPDNRETYPPPFVVYAPPTSQQGWNWEESASRSREPTGVRSEWNHPGNRGDSRPSQVNVTGRISAESHGYSPLPSHGYPNMMIDPCPPVYTQHFTKLEKGSETTDRRNAWRNRHASSRKIDSRDAIVNKN